MLISKGKRILNQMIKFLIWILISQVLSVQHGNAEEIGTINMENFRSNEIQLIRITDDLVVKYPLTTTTTTTTTTTRNSSAFQVHLYRKCPLRLFECLQNEQLRIYFSPNGQNAKIFADTVEHNAEGSVAVFKNLQDGKYSLSIPNHTKDLCVHHSTGTDGSLWNASLDLQSSPEGKMRFYFTMKDFPELATLFQFQLFLVELENEESRSVVNQTIFSYKNQNETLEIDFHNVKPGEYIAQVTPIDCRCVNWKASNKVPCRRKSSTQRMILQAAASDIQFKNTTENTAAILWYTVAAVVIIVVLAVAGLLLKKTYERIGRRRVSQRGSRSILDPESVPGQNGDFLETNFPILFLYDRQDDRLKVKAADLGEILRKSLPNYPVYDYGNPAEENDIYIEGVQWFAARLNNPRGPNTRVIIIISSGLQKMEQLLLNSERGDNTGDNFDGLSLAALDSVMNLGPAEKPYTRLFCVKFDGIDGESECKSLVPLQRFFLPEHKKLLLNQLVN